jgi:hypothetical protein
MQLAPIAIVIGALWALCFVPASFAQGGPPMLTDDPGTPGADVLEINLSYIEQKTHLERLRSLPHVDFNYGLGEHVQLKYETSWLLSDAPDGGGTRTGLDNSLFGVKWRFLDEEQGGLDMSFYPQLELDNSTGSVSRGLAEPGPNLLLPLEMGRDFGAVRLVGEVGYQFLRTHEDEWIVGVLAAKQLSESLEVMAEMRSVSEKFLNRGDVIANVGLSESLSPRVKVLASVGTGLTHGPDATTFLAYVGLQLLLGKK